MLQPSVGDMSAQEVARLLGIGVTRVTQILKKSGIGTKVGRRWVITMEELEELRRWRRGEP